MMINAMSVRFRVAGIRDGRWQLKVEGELVVEEPEGSAVVW